MTPSPVAAENPPPMSPLPGTKYTANRPPPSTAPQATATSWSHRYRYVGNLLQCLIAASMIVYMYGEWAFFHPVYATRISVTIKRWCGVPAVQPKTPVGHTEMVRPTYFILLTALPLFVVTLLWELLRNFNVRRIMSPYILQLIMVLRRKPQLFGGRMSMKMSIGELLFAVVLLLGGNIFVFGCFYDQRRKKITANALKKKLRVTYEQHVEMVALTFGYSCIFNLAFLFLPATRNCAWMEFFNVSYANGIKYHRALGVITVVTAILHMAGFYAVWVREGEWEEEALPCFGCDVSIKANKRRWMNVFGEISMLCFMLIAVTSIPWVRRRFYNVFYYTHQLFFVAVVFIVLHWGPTIWWLLPSFLVYCVHRALSVVNASAPVKVKEVTAISFDLVKVVFYRASGRDGQYKVGQFLYLNVPAISKLQWHAFTIASSPRTSGKTVTVLLKSLGDWTQDLVAHANDCKDKNVLPTVYVDGFYGTSLEFYDEYATVCLVAGGIGATPMFAILEDFAAKLSARASLTQRLVFIYSFRELALLEEIHPVLKKVRLLDPQEKHFKTHFYLTRAPAEADLKKKLRAETTSGPSSYADEKTATAAIAFHEPVRASWLRVLAWVAAFLFAVLIVVLLEYGGGKIQRHHPKLWALQQFVEILMVLLAAFLVGCVAFAERVYLRRLAQQFNTKDSVVQPSGVVLEDLPAPDRLTHRDLVALYSVVVGERPALEPLLAETHEFHTKAMAQAVGRPVIGTFVSGPCPMKRAVVSAAAHLGVADFDIHMEAFKL